MPRYNRILCQLPVLLLMSSFSISSFADGGAVYQLDKKQRSAVVDTMAKEINQQYIFPELGKKTASFITKQLNEGAYAHIVDGKAFAKKLTNDLQSINHDKHMRVRFTPPPPPPPPPSANSQMAEIGMQNAKLQQLKQRRLNQEDNHGFYKVERLEGNVGYLDLRYFSGSKKAQSSAIAAMKFLQNTDSLIIDMRRNTGGSPKMVEFICSYFFAADTHLNSLYWRVPDITEEYRSLKAIEGKRRLDVPVYILTSSKTFSGAEELSYNFKTQKRATIVGEVTGGGANPGGEVRLNTLFGMFMPTGTAINPITKTNWEGVGVIPDVKIASEQAFDKAYQLAKISADEYRLNDLDNMFAQSQELTNQLAQSEILITKNKGAATLKIKEILQQGLDNDLLDEDQINMMGYQYLITKKNIDMAILVFRFNAQAFPNSYNVFDSLGEAYLKQGNNKLARQHYKKSLQLNPNNTNAKQALSQ